jgi:isopenicillin-N N-acyltransferase-like protein
MISIQEKAINHRQMPLVEVRGSHREIGRQMGEACRQQVKHSIETARKLLNDTYDQLQLTWESAQIQSHKYMPYAEERYPQYVEEMRGIAEGADVPYDDVAVVNAMEAVTTDALHLTKCTSMAVNQHHTANRHVLMAHNEDWVPEDEADVYMVHASPDDEIPFLAMNYGGLLPNIGINAAGIAQCCDTVYPTDIRMGIPRVVVSRAVLGARNLSQAIRHMVAPQRAAGYNHLLGHESGELYSVEVSARKFALIYAEEGYIVHTNHYLDYQMTLIEDEPDELISTRIRYGRALSLIKQTPLHTYETLQNIQRDHVNFEDSICNHLIEDDDPLDREKTITALLIDLTTREIQASWGNPCSNAYTTYHLKG